MPADLEVLIDEADKADADFLGLLLEIIEARYSRIESNHAVVQC